MPVAIKSSGCRLSGPTNVFAAVLAVISRSYFLSPSQFQTPKPMHIHLHPFACNVRDDLPSRVLQMPVTQHVQETTGTPEQVNKSTFKRFLHDGGSGRVPAFQNQV
jgi:hypothetical protein